MRDSDGAGHRDDRLLRWRGDRDVQTILYGLMCMRAGIMSVCLFGKREKWSNDLKGIRHLSVLEMYDALDIIGTNAGIKGAAANPGVPECVRDVIDSMIYMTVFGLPLIFTTVGIADTWSPMMKFRYWGESIAAWMLLEQYAPEMPSVSDMRRWVARDLVGLTIVDEISMVSLRLLAALLYRLCYARRDNEDGFDPDFFHQPRHMFGGISLVFLTGDLCSCRHLKVM